MNNNQILDLKETAQLLKVSEMTARRWCKSGKIPSIKIGNRYRIRMSDINAMFNKQES